MSAHLRQFDDTTVRPRRDSRAESGPGGVRCPRQARLGSGTGARLAYLDNLKVGLIAGIIAAHAINSYTEFGSWSYQPVREVSVSPATETVFVVVLSFAALFLMGLFFLIAGLLTPPSLRRKGIKRFTRDRLLRLGVPFAAFTLLLWPLTVYAIREPFLHRGSYWYWFIHMDPFLDNGPMWFIGVLLVYSLGYAAWRSMRSRHPETTPGGTDRPLRARTLIGLGAAIALMSFLVRLVFPVNSAQLGNPHLWEWPQCLGMFALGVASARHGWLMPVTDHMRRRCGVVALIAAAALPVMILSADPLGIDEHAYFGGFGWPALATAVVEGALAVTSCVWVIGFAQRRLDRQGRLRQSLARSSYGAFLVQGPVLVGLALALRPFDMPGEVKALALAISGVAASFAFARLLVTRTGLGRIL
jgi:hypothetical protein